MFPRWVVALVAGLGGMCGCFSASLFQLLVGYAMEKQHSCTVPFVLRWAPTLQPARLGASLQQEG